jgi:hypothetical protein
VIDAVTPCLFFFGITLIVVSLPIILAALVWFLYRTVRSFV